MATKLKAISFERYRATAVERRLYAGKTVTKFYVYAEADAENAARWAIVEGYGPTPGDRKTDALRKGRAELVRRGIIPA